MKSYLTILKFALLALLLVGITFGYIFFRVWQKNERPEITSSEWTKSEILLGHSSTLRLTIKAPWHREITSANPFSSPNSLIPVTDKATFTKGSLSPLGFRTWTLSVPFVATDSENLDGLSASFPVKGTKRVSPNSVNLVLPPLKVLTPDNLPDTPKNSEDFLTEEKPKEDPDEEENTEAEKTNPWLWALAALILIPILIYFLKRTGIIKTTPPWEKALGFLDNLDPEAPPVRFYSKLTDILKQYTSERYSVRGRSKTSAEFLAILQDHPKIPKQHLGQLESFARLADAVKFADHNPDQAEAPQSLALIKKFVNDTTPNPEEAGKEAKSQ